MIRKGVPKSVAAAKLKIHRVTIFNWLKEADEIVTPKTPKDRLLIMVRDGILQARAEFCETCVENIQKAAPADWRAAAFLLERRMPQDFSERKSIETTINQSPVQKALDTLPELDESGLRSSPAPMDSEGGADE